MAASPHEMENTTPVEEQLVVEPIRFRAGKNRKSYRQRSAVEGGVHIAPAAPAPATEQLAPQSLPNETDLSLGLDTTGNQTTSAESKWEAVTGEKVGDGAAEDKEDDDDDDEDESSAVAAAMRLRQKVTRRGGRLRGVGFRSEMRAGDESEQALVLRELEREEAEREGTVQNITDRFMHQTGLLTHIDDRHMNAYIESRLASRNASLGAPRPHPFSNNLIINNTHNSNNSNSDHTSRDDSRLPQTANTGTPSSDPSAAAKQRDQPIRQGKLFEVELPVDVPSQSAADKRRRIDESANPPRRRRNRRNSDDIMRDKLVDEFLHENRLEVYDVPKQFGNETASAPGQDPSADERLAEQFREQYLNEMAMRRKRKRPPQTQQQLQQRQQQSSDVLKGPKLGGSRNSRAAVRDILLQQQEQKKKGTM